MVNSSSIGTECFLSYQVEDGSNTDRHPQSGSKDLQNSLVEIIIF